MSFLIDHAAKRIALNYGLPECLHVPVGAVDEAAIKSYIGDIEDVLAEGSPPRALLVKMKPPPLIDIDIPIWKYEASRTFHQPRQVWVHIAFTRYRNAYKRAFPDEPIDNKVLSHLVNRRIAALKGLSYVRLTPTSRGCNSSSILAENWGVGLWSKAEEITSYQKRGAFIQYGDLPDLLVMLDMKIGGGVMATVNEAQKLLQRP